MCKVHPDLLNNSFFLRYYKQWQDDPSSVVFAPIADYLLRYGMINDAMKVCREGIKHHPRLVIGRIVMARIHVQRGNWEEAQSEIEAALAIAPMNTQALSLANEIAASLTEGRPTDTTPQHPREDHPIDHGPPSSPSWSTITMAGIYAAQGHYDEARKIYASILSSDPDNGPAMRGLASLPAENAITNSS